MAKLIESVEFRTPCDNFQNTLRKDIAHLRDSQAVFVPAGKTWTLYGMGKVQYEKLLRENITRHYGSANEDAYDEINAEAQVITSKLGIANRMDVMPKRDIHNIEGPQRKFFKQPIVQTHQSGEE